MATQLEKRAYNNLLYKYEKSKAKIDVLELKYQDLEKENQELRKKLEKSEKKNEELEKEAKKKQDSLYNEIAKSNEKVANLNNKKK